MLKEFKEFARRGNVVDMAVGILNHRHFIFWCFVIFLGIRAILFLLPLEQVSDAAWYLNRALGIASGEGYSEKGFPTAWRPIGYPGFLGILFLFFGKYTLIGQLANLVLAAGSFFLVLLLTRRIFGNETAARIAIVLLTVYPNNAAYTPLLLSETYFTFLILLGSYLYISRNSMLSVVLVGLIFGLAALTRPPGIFFPAFLVTMSFFISKGKSAKLKATIIGGVIYLMIAVILVPWAVRNTLLFHEIVLFDTHGGFTLLLGNNPSANGLDVENDPLVGKANFSLRDQAAADRRAKALAIQWIKENPGRFIFYLIPLKIWNFWSRDGEAEWAYQAGYKRYGEFWYLFRAVRILNQLFYILLIIGLFVSIHKMWKYRNITALPWSLIGYVFIIYLTLISVAFEGMSRYHFPLMPWIIMYVSWIVGMFLERERVTTNQELAENKKTRKMQIPK